MYKKNNMKTLGLPSPAFLLCPGDIGGLGLAFASGDNASGLLGYDTYRIELKLSILFLTVRAFLRKLGEWPEPFGDPAGCRW